MKSFSRMFSWLFVLFSYVVLSGLFVACEEGATGQTCTSGQIVGCTCSDQTPGSQACSGGTWTQCNCTQGQCQNEVVVACKCGSQNGSQSCTGGNWGPCSCVAGSCQDGKSLTCQCSGGQVGSQNCAGGVWSACQGCPTKKPLPPGGNCTTPGGNEACQCSGGESGTRDCGQDKKWTVCKCNSNPPKPVCAIGQSDVCTCSDGASGQRACVSGGQWGACTCKPTSVCSDGDTQKCICSNLGKGKQRCIKTGDSFAWGVCNECVDPKEVCAKPGESKRCICPNGGSSWKDCSKEGKWLACDCGQSCTEGDVRKNDCDCPGGFKGDNKCIKNTAGTLNYICQCSCTPKETRECACSGSQKGARTCKADQTWGACACPKCKKDADCAKQTTAKLCDPTTEKCVECMKNDQCTGGKICAPATASCVECVTNDDCKGKAPATCYPLDYTCKKFGMGSIAGVIRRCQDAPGPGRCSGNVPKGDDKGRLYFLFFTGVRLPPSYDEKPFLVYKTALTDFKDPTKEVKYQVDNIPEGSWLVYVFLDDNNNWSPGQHMPDPGDLVGFIKGVTVKAGKTASVDFPLTDRY